MSPIYRAVGIEQFEAINVLSDPGYLPGPKIIPGAAMVRLNWSLANGRIAHNILYATYTGTPALGVATAQAIFAGIINGALWSTMAAFIIPGTTLTGVTILDVRSGTGVEFNSTGAAMPGTSAGTGLPDEVAIAITLRTATRGPSGRGRIFMPGWASSATAVGGVIAAATVAAINAWAATNLAGVMATNIGSPVLGLPARKGYTSPVTGRVFPARAATTVPITTFTVKDNHWDSQRRRGLR